MKRALFLILACATVLSAQQVSGVYIPPVYGQLWEDGVGSVINIPTGGTFVKWSSSIAGQYKRTTLSTDDDSITIDSGGAGVYLVAFQVSYVGSAAEVFHWGVHVGGVKQNMASSEIKVGAASMESQSGIGLLALNGGDVVDLRVTSATNTKTATVNHVQLTLVRVGI